MSKETQFKPSPQGIYSADVLREKIFKPGDSVYFLLFAYSNPDTIKAFKGEILRQKTNADLTIDYVVRITNAFEKREMLKDFFHNNWFKTAIKSYDVQKPITNENVKMFSFVDTELVEEIENKNFSYGKYKTFFNNHVDKFNFWVNEAFIFDSHKDSMTYLAKLNFASTCKYLRQIHDLTVTKHAKESASKLYIKSTAIFIKEFKPMILRIIDDMGVEFEDYKKTNKGIYKFFDEYILNRHARRSEFSNSRKWKLRRGVKRDLWRERESRD